VDPDLKKYGGLVFNVIDGVTKEAAVVNPTLALAVSLVEDVTVTVIL
jgi:hypothetical protein